MPTLPQIFRPVIRNTLICDYFICMSLLGGCIKPVNSNHSTALQMIAGIRSRTKQQAGFGQGFLYRNEILFFGFYRCVNSGESLTN